MSKLPRLTLDDLANNLANHGIAVYLVNTPQKDNDSSVAIQGVSIDSRRINKGMLFICKGAAFKASYLADAVSAGAVAYLCENELIDDLVQAAPSVPALVVDDLRKAMAYVSAQVYGYPDERLTVYGITGTKGKSTVAYMLKSIFEADGRTPSILGSINTDDGVEHFASRNTTPEAPDLWRHLFNTEQAKRESMIMEVSSQALRYDRTLGLSLTVGCFLNIGRDHISPLEHENFEDYLGSKLKIFEQSKVAVINLNSEFDQRVADAAQLSERVISFGVNRPEANYCASNLHAEVGCVKFDLTERREDETGNASKPTTIRIKLGMAGLFNVHNALAAIAMARVAGIEFSSITAGLERLRVPGRMEVITSPDGNILTIVDYAHNQLSFEMLFRSVKAEHPNRKIISVFGAPGDKAYERRHELPQVAGAYSDLMIFTEDDPAHERVEDICAELARNTPEKAMFEIIYDREEAIRRAMEEAAQEPSVVLLLAKGAETHQHRGDEYPTIKSDLEIARELLLG